MQSIIDTLYNCSILCSRFFVFVRADTLDVCGFEVFTLLIVHFRIIDKRQTEISYQT